MNCAVEVMISFLGCFKIISVENHSPKIFYSDTAVKVSFPVSHYIKAIKP